MKRSLTSCAAPLAALLLAACGGSSHSGGPARPAHGAGAGHATAPAHTTTAPPSPPPAVSDVSGLPTVSVDPSQSGVAVPPGYVGLSFEYWNLPTYAGTDPHAIDPVFEALVRGLAPGGRPVLRIGGVSTDHTWAPVSNLATPPWVQFTLTPAWLSLAKAVSTALNAQLILGVNLEANSDLIADAEAGALVTGIGANHIAGLELGNEPELWASFPWYRQSTDVRVKGRSESDWSPATFASQFRQIAASLPRSVPTVGPAVGSPKWTAVLGQILSANPELKLATIHSYPLKRCRATTHVTAAQLLDPASSTGLAARLSVAAHAAHALGDKLRVAEMNSVSCGGEPGLSDSFASALWSVDVLFAFARAGIDGVNFHSTPTVSNHLFTVEQAGGHWQGQVYPIYYGITMFNQAAPAGSHLIAVSTHVGSAVREWATRASDGTIRVVLINTSPSTGRTLAVQVPGATAAATVERMIAPGGLAGQTGITLGGQSFGSPTTTGTLQGTPQTATVSPQGGRYAVQLPAASAVLLTIR